jgi:hypothetical protein
MIGKFARVQKIGHSLRRGVRYYRFIIKVSLLDNFRFFRFLEFLSYSLFDYIGSRNYYFTTHKQNEASFILKNINGFSNLRFSDNFYLAGMPNDLMVNFFNPEFKDYFDSINFFLSLFKLI